MNKNSFFSNPLYHHLALLIMRLGFGGLMFINHGLPKFNKLVGVDPIKFYDFLGIGAGFSLGLAVFAEAIMAILIVLGLFTRWAAFFAAFTMAVAVFDVHLHDGLKEQEHALLFLIGYLTILLLGSGKFAIDNYLNKR